MAHCPLHLLPSLPTQVFSTIPATPNGPDGLLETYIKDSRSHIAFCLPLESPCEKDSPK